MAAPAPISISSSSFSYRWTYDVFLSFRGLDTRHGFTGNLYHALVKGGIHTFIDHEELQGGEEITPSLLNAIQESRIAIVVFSKNYASSSFCLDELAYILECIKQNGRLVLPVFYDVDPSEVRHQRGSYGEALARHEERFKANTEKLNDNMEKLKKWKMALHQTANLSGQHFKQGNEYEYEFIEKIVKEVSKKINRGPLHVANYPVGLESRVRKVCSLLNLTSDDGVLMVGICGIGGMGKTTLARQVYNEIADQFDGLCFLSNVRENSINHGLVHLQQTILSKTVGRKTEFGDVNEGIPIIKQRLHRKKVLLVLDDVDKPEQLQALAGGLDWFRSGSRVIITTRDKHLLSPHGVEITYEVEGLDEKDALELLRRNAFKNCKVDDASFEEQLNRAVTYASGLPLALEVIGSNLFGKRIEEWKSALDWYESIPNDDILNKLKVSFDSLEENEQSVFLDIACCFKGYQLAKVEHILCCHHGRCPKYGIGVLVDKSLIKIESDSSPEQKRIEYGTVTLHDLIQDMGQEIVRRESRKEPGKRSRLWFHEDIVRVLEKNTGTSKIEVMHMDSFKYEVVNWDGMAFKKMKNLKTLIIRRCFFSKRPKHLPNSLRVLEWWQYPSRSLPSDFHPKELAIFKLPSSCLMSIELPKSRMRLVNLTVLDFSHSERIKKIPDVSGLPNLEKLSFKSCVNLIKIHRSVGFLNKLRILDAWGCRKLRTFPPINLTSLEKLHLSDCRRLKSFPEILGKMEKITELELYECPIKELPSSIGNLTRLQKLKLQYCGIVRLQRSIFKLQGLNELIVDCNRLLFTKRDEGEEQGSSMVPPNIECLELKHCKMLDEFLPLYLTWFPNVKRLDLSSSKFTILPACIKECRSLKEFDLRYCEELQEIRGIPPNLETFIAIRCTSLKVLDLTLLPACTKECHFLKYLNLNECFNLEEIRGIPPNLENFSAKECASLKDLDLSLPPACTKLGVLALDDCQNLQEIRGIPPSINKFFARNCTSLTSPCRNMLLNEELHEEGGHKLFVLPGTTIPEWFEHDSKGGSISFWFRNNFPAISLCVVNSKIAQFYAKLAINSKEELTIDIENVTYARSVVSHVYIVDIKLNEVLLGNDWNRVDISICRRRGREMVTEQTGLHVFKQKSCLEDIRFTDPYKKRKLDHDLMTLESESHLLQKEKPIVYKTGQRVTSIAFTPGFDVCIFK